ncbi:hypothetical protein EVAR_99171_1 [Eumeta japonica]|uniref:Uncharacterized protein n=1 Tax=Eumeta variegata TaxID=151549 RepID=A0A4C1T680_EUMVA|nr:hypothetical protein EVAR_99171_1 [Eumeta japonica]
MLHCSCSQPGIEAVARICTGSISNGEAVPESRMGTGSPRRPRPEAVVRREKPKILQRSDSVFIGALQNSPDRCSTTVYNLEACIDNYERIQIGTPCRSVLPLLHGAQNELPPHPNPVSADPPVTCSASSGESARYIRSPIKHGKC